jgi:uncharacterized membrane protein SpoIIM required for sporulation
MSKGGWLVDNYKRSFDLIKRSWTYTLITLAVLLLTTIIGFLFPRLFEQQVLAIIQDMLMELEGLTTIELVIYIFLNNLKATFFAIVFGIFFGIFPIITGIVNGYVIGFTANFAVSQSGPLILWRLIPHGIFEIPAVLLSMGVGLYLGSRFIEKRFKVKSIKKRISLIGLFSFITIPFGVIYYYLSLKILENGANNIAVISGGNILGLVIVAIMNLIVIGIFVYILFVFFRNKELRRDLIDALIFFIFIILPLLLIAGIIEGVLVGLVG